MGAEGGAGRGGKGRSETVLGRGATVGAVGARSRRGVDVPAQGVVLFSGRTAARGSRGLGAVGLVHFESNLT